MADADPGDGDFLAFMFVELSKFPCLHRDGDHHGPPLMWPELIACIVARAKQDATARLVDACRAAREFVLGDFTPEGLRVLSVLNAALAESDVALARTAHESQPPRSSSPEA